MNLGIVTLSYLSHTSQTVSIRLSSCSGHRWVLSSTAVAPSMTTDTRYISCMFRQTRSQSGSTSRRGQTWVLGCPRMPSRAKYEHP